MSLGDSRSFAQRSQRPTLSAREQLALTLLHGEWSNRELQMCFEVEHVEDHITKVSQHTAGKILQFEVER